jgi:Lipoate-protein ligase A
MRLVIEGGNSGGRQMALDETMLILLDRNIIPETLRLWNFSPTTLSIGRFLAVRDWVNEDLLRRYSIPLVRRFTGGGPALHDEKGEITWTVVLKMNDMMKAYKIIADGLISAIKEFGLKGEFTPINDVVIEGKKVVGMAGALKKSAVVVHGTFMFDTNLELMDVIKVPKVKEVDRGKPKTRVTTISAILGEKISREKALNALIKGFSEVFKLEEGELTEIEYEISNQLTWKYTNPNWTYVR